MSYDEGTIEGIHIRLGLRQELGGLIAGVVQAARALDCVLFFPEARAMVEASEPGLEQALRQSRAARFVSAPRAFLEGESPDGLQRET